MLEEISRAVEHSENFRFSAFRVGLCDLIEEAADSGYPAVFFIDFPRCAGQRVNCDSIASVKVHLDRYLNLTVRCIQLRDSLLN